MCPANAKTAPDLSLALDADPVAVRLTLRDVMQGAAIVPLNTDQRARLEIVLAEVLNNIVEHAYADFPGQIELRIFTAAEVLRCEVTDYGRQMPGNQAPAGRNASLDVPPEDLPEGGFGWFLIRSLTRDLQYQRDGEVNRLCFSMDLRTGTLFA